MLWNGSICKGVSSDPKHVRAGVKNKPCAFSIIPRLFRAASHNQTFSVASFRTKDLLWPHSSTSVPTKNALVSFRFQIIFVFVC